MTTPELVVEALRAENNRLRWKIAELRARAELDQNDRTMSARYEYLAEDSPPRRNPIWKITWGAHTAPPVGLPGGWDIAAARFVSLLHGGVGVHPDTYPFTDTSLDFNNSRRAWPWVVAE